MLLKLNTKNCPMCGEHDTFEAEDVDILAWYDGAYVQDAFPYLTASQRERLITGLCEKCFPDDLDDDENEYDSYSDLEQEEDY
jgi:hypothetical protein